MKHLFRCHFSHPIPARATHAVITPATGRTLAVCPDCARHPVWRHRTALAGRVTVFEQIAERRSAPTK